MIKEKVQHRVIEYKSGCKSGDVAITTFVDGMKSVAREFLQSDWQGWVGDAFRARNTLRFTGLDGISYWDEVRDD